MKKFILILVPIMLIFSVQCDSVIESITGEDSTDEGWCDLTVDESDAAAINVQLMQEITGLFSDVSGSSSYPDYESDDGSVVVEGEYTTYPYYFEFKFKFDNYEGSYLNIKSGEVTYIDEVDDYTAIHYWKYNDGYFEIEIDSEEYEVWWDFEEYNRQGVLYYDGTFKICKSEYDYGGSYK
jgi:hypothetical protein